MPTLMGHLAQFSAFNKQGELLCTQGLAHILRNSEAGEAFNAHYLRPAGITYSGQLTWQAEARQEDRARPDLEATTGDGKPVAKIEAKLGAALSEDQLRSYVADLRRRAAGGLLLVLVPSYRIKEALALVSKAFVLSGSGPQWRLSDFAGCVVTVSSWEEILSMLTKKSAEPFGGDFAQFRDLYRTLIGDYFEAPPAGKWRECEGSFIVFVDRATRKLTPQGQILPLGSDGKNRTKAYERRYVCRPTGAEKASCYSIGVCDPFPKYSTPIWLRFHRVTGMFDEIRKRLRESDFSGRLVEHQGHVWIPLDIPSNETDGKLLVDSLVRQANAIERIAYP